MNIIRRASNSDVDAIVKVHLACFDGSFLSFLGPPFVGALYKEVLREPDNVSLVVESREDGVIGFVVGVKDRVALYKRLAHKKWASFALASIRPALGRPRIIPRLWRAVRYTQDAVGATCPAEMISIAVLPSAGGNGEGKRLVHEFLAAMAAAKVDRVCLTIERDNNAAMNAFCQKLGFIVARQFHTREARWMNEYVIEVQDPEKPKTACRTIPDNGANGDVLAQWFKRRGFTVIESKSSSWYEAGPRVYQAIPFHRIIEPDESELRDILVRHAAIALRFSAPRTAQLGAVSYHIVLDSPEYDISRLKRQSRQNIGVGLKNFTVEPIPFSVYAKEGWALHHDTLIRQRRRDRITRADWEKSCEIASGLPGFEVWGALLQGELTASILFVRMHDWILLLHQDCLTKHLDLKPNHALVYNVTKELMKREGVKGIFYTLQSLDAPPEIDDFKLRMGYRLLPVKQRVVFHPSLSSVVVPHTRNLIQKIHRRFPSSPFLAKAEGLVGLAVEGMLPECEQHIPSILGESMERHAHESRQTGS